MSDDENLVNQMRELAMRTNGTVAVAFESMASDSGAVVIPTIYASSGYERDAGVAFAARIRYLEDKIKFLESGK